MNRMSRYHLYVNNSGEVLLLQLELEDGSKLEPWQPANPVNQTVLGAITTCGTHYQFSIHTERFTG